jgi:hypothetical protein
MMRIRRFSRPYAGPGSWTYGFIKCLRCPKETPRDRPLCVACQQKQQRFLSRKK